MDNERNHRRQQSGSFPQNQEAKPAFKLSELNEKTYVEMAERVVNAHKQANSKKPITMTQMRNLLELMSVLRERLRTDRRSELDDEMVSQVQYIKLRFVYAAGRDTDQKGVRDFIIQSQLIECLDTVKNSAGQFEFVCKYMEALVAYHKYLIGK